MSQTIIERGQKEKKKEGKKTQKDKPPGDQGMKNIRVRDKVTLREKNWGRKTVRKSIRVRNLPCH